MKFDYVIKKVKELIKMHSRGELDFNPQYQRQYIWTKDLKVYLIFSLLKAYPIGTIVLWFNKRTNKYEVVDGQQRLKTILDFIEPEPKSLTLTKSFFQTEYRKILENNLKTDSFSTDVNYSDVDKNLEKNVLSFASLPTFYKDQIKETKLLTLDLKTDSASTIADYFTYIQNQEKLKIGEIMAAYPNSKMNPFLKKIEKSIKIIAKECLMFNDKRKEFIKLFVTVIGLQDEKLELGCVDTKVLQFFADNEEKLSLKDNTIKRIDECLDFLKKIIDSKTLKIKLKSWKRFFKLLFVLFFVCHHDFEPNFEKQLSRLVEINDILATHASKHLTDLGKRDEIEKFYKGHLEYWDYEKDLQLFKITKDVQKKEDVKKIACKLAFYLKKVFG